jgi:undecaprenyldiphospho-muramoylpentapeptide beta-N-acetylglucosaminyltransferase
VTRTYLLAGGGTAGHVNPLLATAAELISRGHNVVALGTERGLEKDLVPRVGVELRTIPRAAAPRRINGDLFRFPGRLRRAIRETSRIIDEVRPEVVVGFGGYASTPAYIVAHRRGIPIVLHEANARPGLANRLGARWATRVAITFPGTPLRGGIVTGLPLRAEIAELAIRKRAGKAGALRASSRAALGWPEDAVAALIMGGSLGAAKLNGAIAEAIPSIVGHGIYLIHLTGRGKDVDAERAFGDLPAKHRQQYVVEEYELEMAKAFAAVDAVVCRAGAVTVAEVSALGLPALYVPLPIGNGEQSLNAAPAVEAGAATLIEDAHLTAAALTLRLEAMLLDTKTAKTMAAAARKIGIINGAERLATLVEEASR